jgi:hypothetical protein
MKSGEAIIDLMAILPAYLNFFVRSATLHNLNKYSILKIAIEIFSK